MITTRQSSSSSSAVAMSSSSANIVMVMALWRSGRFSVTTTTPGRRSSRSSVWYCIGGRSLTCGDCGDHAGLADVVDGADPGDGEAAAAVLDRAVEPRRGAQGQGAQVSDVHRCGVPLAAQGGVGQGGVGQGGVSQQVA